MNIEIANKLLQLRKEKGFSQEQLAAELGISRQAISKWERAEASPDTDNLIELARLYGVSLDQLLLHEPDEENIKNSEQGQDNQTKDENKEKNNYVHVGLDGIHVKEEDGDEVHVTWHGIHVKEKGGDSFKIGGQNLDINGEEYEDGVYINGKKYEKEDWYNWQHYHGKHYFPIGMLVIFGALIYAVITGVWHPTWIILLTVPIIGSFIEALRKRKWTTFAYPVLATMIFLWYGFTQGAWHPSWVIFLTITCYYAIAHYFDHRKDF